MKEKILELRKEGKTYNEIKEIVGCSKGTVAYYCGTNQKEKAAIRKKKNSKDICSCGNSKNKSATNCNNCSLLLRRETVLKKPIKELFQNFKDNHRFVLIRKFARLFMKEAKIPKVCKLCEFKDYVEVCHIKGISKFSEDALLSEVNSLDNLVYLCPNHHLLFDKGLISL